MSGVTPDYLDRMEDYELFAMCATGLKEAAQINTNNALVFAELAGRAARALKKEAEQEGQTVLPPSTLSKWEPIDVINELRTNGTAVWGEGAAGSKHYKTFDFKDAVNGYDGVSVHHSVTPLDFTYQDIHTYHAHNRTAWYLDNQQVEKGTEGAVEVADTWPRFAYTAAAHTNGDVFLCNPLGTYSYAQAGSTAGKKNNQKYASICYIGEGTPTAAQIEGIKRFWHWVEDQTGRELAIIGHGQIEGNYTACPGDWASWGNKLTR